MSTAVTPERWHARHHSLFCANWNGGCAWPPIPSWGVSIVRPSVAGGGSFDQVVKYEFGDDVRDVDWNVSARLGDLYRKKFIEERELTVVILLEDTPSLQFGSGQRTKREALLELAGLFALTAAGNRDRVGFWHATPSGHHVRQPVRGRVNIVRTAATLLAQPIPKLEDGPEVSLEWKLFFHAFPKHSIGFVAGRFSTSARGSGMGRVTEAV